jgi:hypothetical protein
VQPLRSLLTRYTSDAALALLADLEKVPAYPRGAPLSDCVDFDVIEENDRCKQVVTFTKIEAVKRSTCLTYFGYSHACA